MEGLRVNYGLHEDRLINAELEGAHARLIDICEERQCGRASVEGQSDSGRKLQALVLRLGERKADRCMVLCSGASREGGILVAHLYADILGNLTRLPDDFSLLIVSAVNPEGRPWPPHFLPQKEGYKRWQNPILQNVDDRFARDQQNFQYDNRKQRDLFTGRVRSAHGAAWEERVLKEIYNQFLVQAKTVISVDIRPSFRVMGKLDIWSSCNPEGENHAKLKSWFRRLQRESLYDFYASYGKHATVGPGVFVEEERLLSLRVECGTYTPSDILGGGIMGAGVIERVMPKEQESSRKKATNLRNLFDREHIYWKNMQREVQGIITVLLDSVNSGLDAK